MYDKDTVGQHNIQMLKDAGLAHNKTALHDFDDDFRGKIKQVHLFGPAATPYCIIETERWRNGQMENNFYTLRSQLIAGDRWVVIVDTRVYHKFEHALAFCLAPGYADAINTLIDADKQACIATSIAHSTTRTTISETLVPPIMPISEK